MVRTSAKASPFSLVTTFKSAAVFWAIFEQLHMEEINVKSVTICNVDDQPDEFYRTWLFLYWNIQYWTEEVLFVQRMRGSKIFILKVCNCTKPAQRPNPKKRKVYGTLCWS